MRQEQDENGPYLLLNVAEKYGSRTWQIRAVRLENGKPRNYASGFDNPLDDFTISVHYWDKEYLDRTPDYRKEITVGSGDYGYRDAYNIGPSRARAMAKYLTAVEKELEKLSEKFGYAHTFPSFVLRVAAAIRAKGFLRETTHGGSFYTECEYKELTPPEAAFYIENDMREYIEKLFPTQDEGRAA